MIFHFDFANYFRVLRLVWFEPNPDIRRRYMGMLLVALPLVSSFHALCFLLDGLLFPSLFRTKITAPVFVVGHARSGTTLVHRLMSRDEGRFSAFVLYELYFPSLIQKKLIRAFARIDRRYLGGWLEGRVRAWEKKRYAAMRGIHEMGLDKPEEDDLVFYYSLASGFWITKLPYMGELDFYYVDRWSERKRRRLLRFYADCVKRQLHLNGGALVHLSKNPIFAGRVEALIEAFPDARFVVPVRNPLETIPSLLQLVRSGWKRLGWEPERVERSLRILAQQSYDTYRHPLEVLSRHPDTLHSVVDYRALVEDPASAIEGVYRDLDLPVSARYREVLQAERGRAARHTSSHAYSLEKFNLAEDEIRTQLADLFERFEWQGGGPQQTEGEEA